MKNFFFFIFLSAFMAACFGCAKDDSVTGCKGDELPTIVGNWVGDNAETETPHTIQITEQIIKNCENDNCQEGPYLFTGDRLVFGINDFYVKEVSCNYLVLTSNGKDRRFSKE
jgi:hypothetical protein